MKNLECSEREKIAIAYLKSKNCAADKINELKYDVSFSTLCKFEWIQNYINTFHADCKSNKNAASFHLERLEKEGYIEFYDGYIITNAVEMKFLLDER